MKKKVTLVLCISFIVESGNLWSSEMTAPLPPAFELEPESQIKLDKKYEKLAFDFLEQEITVRTGLVSTKKIKIAQDWKNYVLVIKEKDQEKNETQNIKKNALKWLNDAYDIIIPYWEKKQDAQEQFVKLYSDTPISLKSFAWFEVIKQYKVFLNSKAFKDLLFKKGMHALGYKVIRIADGQHPDEHKKSRKKSTKSEEKLEENKQIKAKIDELEAKMLQQHKKIDAFNLQVDEIRGRSEIKGDHAEELKKMMGQMQQEKEKLEQFKDEIKKPFKSLQRKKIMMDLDLLALNGNLLPKDTVSPEQKSVELPLSKNIDAPVDVSVKNQTQDEKDIISSEFRAMVASKAQEIAQKLIENGESVQDFQNEEISFDFSNAQMSYFMGYIQQSIDFLTQSKK